MTGLRNSETITPGLVKHGTHTIPYAINQCTIVVANRRSYMLQTW